MVLPQDDPALRLITEANAAERFADRFPEFDFDKSSPAFYTNLNLPAGTVLQSFTINEPTNQIYSTQVYSTAAPAESYIIGRLTIDGVLLDSMILTHGGHGTTIGLETVGSDVYVWSHYYVLSGDGSSVTGNKLVRFKYVAGAVYNSTSPGLVEYNKFTTDYITPVVDSKNGTICFRRTVTGGGQVLELRNLSDVKTGLNSLLGSITIESTGGLQGVTIDGDYAYWYTGDTNAVNFPNKISRYRFSTGQKDREITGLFGLSVDGVTYEDNYREPEGVNLYTDPETGKKTLFAGVVTGEAGRRIAKIYGYHEAGNSDKFTGYKAQAAQGYKLTRNNGYVKRIPIGLTSLTLLTDPGYYYATSAEVAALIDMPWTGWGVFIDNTPREINGSIRQTVERNTQTATNERIERRILTIGGTAGAWRTLHNGAANTALTIPAGTTRLIDVVTPGTYYISSATAATLTDHPDPTWAGFLDVSKTAIAGNNDRYITLRRSTATKANMRVYDQGVYNDGTATGWVLRHTGAPVWTNITTDAAFTTAAALAVTPVPGGVKNDLRGQVMLPGTYTAGMSIGTLPAGFIPTAGRKITVGIDDATNTAIDASTGRTAVVQFVAGTGNIRLWSNPGVSKYLVFDGATYYL